MPLFPVAASAAWLPVFPRSSLGTRDKIASGSDKRGGRGPLHPAPCPAIPELRRVAVALRPQKENTICSPHRPDRESQISVRDATKAFQGGALIVEVLLQRSSVMRACKGQHQQNAGFLRAEVVG
jgi:hypothetical protein